MGCSMMGIQASILSEERYLFNILNFVQVDLTITENPYCLPIESLFTMAARMNKKRSFLFVSKLLGKHIPINPKIGLFTSALLALRYYETIYVEKMEQREQLIFSFLNNDNVFHSYPFITEDIHPVIIGFAETATALGQAFFDCFEKAEYFHTTREFIDSMSSIITFEEEHSHATSHRSYIQSDMIHNNREIILVDDELTTGKTVLNIIRSIHSTFPRSIYTVVSILDFRSEKDIQEFNNMEVELGVTIRVISLLSGKIKVNQLKERIDFKHFENEKLEMKANIEFFSLQTVFSKENQLPFLRDTGRFGLHSSEKGKLNERINEAANILSKKRKGMKTLCLGTGEFMYLPMRIAAEMGPEVSFQSTTRSPIYICNEPGYGVKYGVNFPSPEDRSISHFVYNIPPGVYDEMFIFFEREVNLSDVSPLLKTLKETEIELIMIVSFC